MAEDQPGTKEREKKRREEKGNKLPVPDHKVSPVKVKMEVM